MRKQTVDVSVVIINHNTKELTGQTIRSVLDTTREVTFEIIVVDNSDDPGERLSGVYDSRVTLLPPVENRGFACGCNFGAQKASGDYVLYLNSDVKLHEGALDRAVFYLKEHPDVGALGIKTQLPDKSLDHGCKRGFPTPSAALYYFLGLDKKYPLSRKYGAYRQTFLSEDETNDVDAVSGAFMLCPRALIEALHGFDEDFFMYGEDLDLCWRIKAKGFRVVYFAGAGMTHFKGQSGLHQRSKRVIRAFYDAMLLFYKKHYRKKYSIFTTALVYTGIRLKYLLTLLKAKVGA